MFIYIYKLRQWLLKKIIENISYTSLIKKILIKYNKIIKEFDHDYSLDNTRVNEWINAQHNNFRKACTSLVNHTHYFNIHDTINLLNQSISKYINGDGNLNIPINIQKIDKFIILLHDDKPKQNDKPAGSLLMFSIIGYKSLLLNGIPEDKIFF